MGLNQTNKHEKKDAYRNVPNSNYIQLMKKVYGTPRCKFQQFRREHGVTGPNNKKEKERYGSRKQIKIRKDYIKKIQEIKTRLRK